MNVLGLQQPSKGAILFDNYDVALWARGHLRPEDNGEDHIGNLSSQATNHAPSPSRPNDFPGSL